MVLAMPPEIGCVATVPIFADLPRHTLLDLQDTMIHRTFSRGELVALAQEPIDSLIVVAQGCLRTIHRSASGREQIVREVGPGEFLGELGLFTRAYYEGDVVAAEKTHACILAKTAVWEALSRNTEASMRLVESLATRLASAEQRVGDLGVRDVSQRLAAELVRAMGDTAQHHVRAIAMPGSWADMAARLGTTPESLSRSLRVLENEGLISREVTEADSGQYRRVIILSPERLREIAGI